MEVTLVSNTSYMEETKSTDIEASLELPTVTLYPFKSPKNFEETTPLYRYGI